MLKAVFKNSKVNFYFLSLQESLFLIFLSYEKHANKEFSRLKTIYPTSLINQRFNGYCI